MREPESDSSINLSKILILNYEMDEGSQLFAHQIDVVRRLADKFQNVNVITGSIGTITLPSNVQVYSTNWQTGRDFRNAVVFIKTFLKLITQTRTRIIFSHMTEVQSALIAPVAWLFRLKHVLWYAHTSKSKAMRINKIFVNQIVSSTKGSCPYSGERVVLIGQAVDPEVFEFQRKIISPPFNLVHVGRLDRSKGIHELIGAAQEVRNAGIELTLTLIGAPSNSEDFSYQSELNELVRRNNASSWIFFQEPVKRALLPLELSRFNIFFHAFQGSLDKTLIEATMLGIPVVTINSEYQKEFGTWAKKGNSNLSIELTALMGLASEEILIETKRRFNLALANHSLDNWINKLCRVLAGK